MRLTDSIRCSGKVNLRLKVTGRRADGYNELDTVFMPLSYPSDEIALYESSSGISFFSEFFRECSEKNLVEKAAELFAESSGIGPAWHFELKKNIPVAAGLGGGSADAAAVLQMLNRRYNALSEEKLAEIALRIGADVPYFLSFRPARATGIGEKLEFLPYEKLPAILVVFPGFPVTAAWAYRHLSDDLRGADELDTVSEFSAAFSEKCVPNWAKLLRNDLAFALYEKFPLLTLLKNFLLENGAAAAEVSGSGPSLFGVFDSAEKAEDCGRRLRQSVYGNDRLRIFTGDAEL